MQVPLEISFHNMDPSPAVEAKVRRKAKWLERYYGRITSCRVVIEAPHQHHHRGNRYHVKVFISLPGGHELAASRDTDQGHAHEDIHVAIHDAFDVARRQVREVVAKMSGKVKTLRGPRHRQP